MKKTYPLILLACLFSMRSFSQCTTPTTVPYYESFNASTANNQLPSCWAISDPTTCVTFTNGGFTGPGSAGFFYTPAQSSYFYSMAVQLYTGITYSASAWYKVTSSNTITWTDFSIFLSTSQTSTALVPIASTNGAAVNIIYTAVSNTFNVASSGVYYFAVRGISNGASGSSVLAWDDLSVIIPCTYTNNVPAVTIVASATSVCSGQNNFTATAGGANTYLWFDGSINPTNTNTPTQSTTYSVVGTSTLTGCTNAASLNLLVKPSPNIIVIATKPFVCIGGSAILMANGASTYS